MAPVNPASFGSMSTRDLLAGLSDAALAQKAASDLSETVLTLSLWPPRAVSHLK